MTRFFLIVLMLFFLVGCSVCESEKPLKYNACGIKSEVREGNFTQKYNFFFWVKFIF